MQGKKKSVGSRVKKAVKAYGKAAMGPTVSTGSARNAIKQRLTDQDIRRGYKGK